MLRASASDVYDISIPHGTIKRRRHAIRTTTRRTSLSSWTEAGNDTFLRPTTLRLQSRRPADLGPPDVDKRQIQLHHQRWPARMRGQGQYQECRTDYRRGLPGGIHVAGYRRECEVPQKMIEAIRPNMVFFWLIRTDVMPQLYFISAFRLRAILCSRIDPGCPLNMTTKRWNGHGPQKTAKNYFVPVCRDQIKIIKENTAESGKTENLLAKICCNLIFPY